jgi:hypothetical protein
MFTKRKDRPITTRNDIKTVAKDWGWKLLWEGDGAIVFMLKSGKTLAARYNQDDKLVRINDAANAAVVLPFVFAFEEDNE